MLDKGRLRRKFILGLLTSPLTLWPFVAGATLLMAVWTFSMRSGLTMFAAVACLLGAFGAMLTRLVLGSDRIARQALDELQKESESEAEQKLNELDRRLAADGDPRDEGLLRDLRTLTRRFKAGKGWPDSLNAMSTFDIVSGVEELFAGSVRSLEKSLELRDTAMGMATDAARKPILLERERLIDDVRRSLEQLGSIVGSIQNLGGADRGGSELAALRKELDESLTVARRVQDRMRDFEQDVERRE